MLLIYVYRQASPVFRDAPKFEQGSTVGLLVDMPAKRLSLVLNGVLFEGYSFKLEADAPLCFAVGVKSNPGTWTLKVVEMDDWKFSPVDTNGIDASDVISLEKLICKSIAVLSNIKSDSMLPKESDTDPTLVRARAIACAGGTWLPLSACLKAVNITIAHKAEGDLDISAAAESVRISLQPKVSSDIDLSTAEASIFVRTFPLRNTLSVDEPCRKLQWQTSGFSLPLAADVERCLMALYARFIILDCLQHGSCLDLSAPALEQLLVRHFASWAAACPRVLSVELSSTDLQQLMLRSVSGWMRTASEQNFQQLLGLCTMATERYIARIKLQGRKCLEANGICPSDSSTEILYPLSEGDSTESGIGFVLLVLGSCAELGRPVLDIMDSLSKCILASARQPKQILQIIVGFCGVTRNIKPLSLNIGPGMNGLLHILKEAAVDMIVNEKSKLLCNMQHSMFLQRLQDLISQLCLLSPEAFDNAGCLSWTECCEVYLSFSRWNRSIICH